MAGSFHDGLVKILQDLGGLEAYPDADPGLIQAIRQPILQAVQGNMAAQQQAAGGMPGMDPSQMGPSMGPGPAMAATRLPRPAPGQGLPDAATIERMLAGTQASNGATA